MQNSVQQSGRHFLQVPGPTPVPERILAAMSRQMMDHRSPSGTCPPGVVRNSVHLQDERSGHLVSFVWQGGPGGSTREYALAWRLRPVCRNRPIRPAVGNYGARSRIDAHRHSN